MEKEVLQYLRLPEFVAMVTDAVLMDSKHVTSVTIEVRVTIDVAIFDVVLQLYGEWVRVVEEHLLDPYHWQYMAYSTAEEQLADRHDGYGGDDDILVGSDRYNSKLPRDDGIRNDLDECSVHLPIVEH